MKIKKNAQQKLKNNIRWHALQLLVQIEHEGQYSNVIIDRFLQSTLLDERDKALLVQIVYGTTQRRLTLDFFLAPFIQGKKIDQWIQTLLRLTVYQLVYLERVPIHAALNEAVNIAKLNGHQAVGNFVNALLRRFLREERPSFDQCETVEERLSITYSMPMWIVKLLLEQLPFEEVEALLASLLEKPVVSARINDIPERRVQMMHQLQEEGFEVEASTMSPYGIRCLKGNLVHSDFFAEGKITIQDESSMLVAPVGRLSGEESVLDACAAPGGKATHIASLLQNGHLTALDISHAKLEKVAQHLQRLNLADKVTLKVADASKFSPQNDALYDMIYLDAPCSGLGLMRRKPEIKYEKRLNDVKALLHIQFELIEHVAGLLRSGGTLIYSTCTLTQEENEHLVETFLRQHPEFMLDPIQTSDGVPANCITKQGYVRVWPHTFQTDGFFICRLLKR